MRSSGDLLADRRFLYARDLAREGDYAAATDLFAQALERVADWVPGWLALGDAKARAGDSDGATAALRQAAALDCDGVFGASLTLAAWTGTNTPASADAAYVRALFDDYAARFEQHLAEDLGYRGPTLLRDAIDRVVPPPARFARAVDLGCGTGLMGKRLRSRVDRLTGVDLSPTMIAKARTKDIYDALITGEMLATLEENPPLDLVTAADVLIYVGDLKLVFSAVAAALRPGGLFAFTVQSAAEGLGVSLGADRRFAHSRDHIVARAEATGFAVALCEARSARRDAGADVPGLVAVLRC